MNTIIALSIALCVCILLMFVGNKYLNYKNGGALKVHENAIYNGKNTNPPLSTINTIGFNLYGDFRTDINGSSVKYLFICLFFPLFPIGCYRARQESPMKYMGRQGVAQVRETKYKIFGTEKWNIVEVLLIYIVTIAIVIGLLLIYNLWDYFF